MESLAEKLSYKLYTYGYVDSTEINTVTYNIQLTIIQFLGVMLVVCIGLLTHNIYGLFLFYFTFAFLRKYSGGYHCNTFLSCTILSIFIITLISVLQLDLSQKNNLLLPMFCIAAIFVIYIGSVNNSSIAWNYVEYRTVKMISRIRCGIVLLGTFAIYGISHHSVFLYYETMAMVINAISLITTKLMRGI